MPIFFRHGYDSSNNKTESNIRKSIALGLYRMEEVKFSDDTYWSLSDDTIITSSSKRKWCLKGNILMAQQGKCFWIATNH